MTEEVGWFVLLEAELVGAGDEPELADEALVLSDAERVLPAAELVFAPVLVGF